MNNWINTEDELPFMFAPVLIWHAGGYQNGCSVGYYNEVSRAWFNVFDLEVTNVVAWQVLPFGPNGEAIVSSDLIKAKSKL